jgi:tungstate transport system permease protein
MGDLAQGFGAAWRLIEAGDPTLLAIVSLSLRVSLAAVLLATVIGLPIGAALAMLPFPGRGGIVVLFNALMGFPPVVAGLFIYLMLSRTGPLGRFGLLFTPTAMVVAQTFLVTPIIAALARQVIEDLWRDYRDQLRSLGAGPLRAIPTLLWDGRVGIATAVLAGFGRASAEVGAIIIVGGNIAGYTRTMTTAIALETSKGDLALALGLGMILLALTLIVNIIAFAAGSAARRAA